MVAGAVAGPEENHVSLQQGEGEWAEDEEDVLNEGEFASDRSQVLWGEMERSTRQELRRDEYVWEKVKDTQIWIWKTYL